MKKLNNLLLIIGVSLIFACNSTKHPEYIIKTDSLLANLDSLSIKFNEINFDSVHIMYDSVMNNNSLIKKNESLDLASNPELKQNLFKYGRIHKAFKKYVQKHERIINDIEFNKKQLENLRNDISNNLISDENVIKYYDDEQDAHINLSGNVNFYIKDVNTSIDLYNDVHGKINIFLKSSVNNE